MRQRVVIVGLAALGVVALLTVITEHPRSVTRPRNAVPPDVAQQLETGHVRQAVLRSALSQLGSPTPTAHAVDAHEHHPANVGDFSSSVHHSAATTRAHGDGDTEKHADDHAPHAQEEDAVRPVPATDMCRKNTHFSFDEAIMPRSFRHDMQKKAWGIAKRWVKTGWQKRFGKVDESKCVDVPECAFYHCLGLDAQEAERGHKKCCAEHRQLRDTAFDVITLLEANNITYFLSTGTALGAVRHGGSIIPWDTDVDLVIRPDDEATVAALMKAHGEKHFFHRDTKGKGMLWVHHSKDGKPRDGPHVEIFFEAHYTDPAAFPVEQCPFYGRTVACPNRKMFDKWFPSGWRAYSGAHFHNPGRCTLYENGKRIEKSKC